MIAVVLALSFLVLLIAFRSLLVPLQAAVTNLICVAAAVFLLSQIAQHREEGEDDRSAVASGVANSAPVIVAAALIMIGVFGSFVLNGDPIVKQFGVGLAGAVFLAATMVLVLGPALLVLVGGRTWWLPRWLSKVVPHADIEGKAIAEAQR